MYLEVIKYCLKVWGMSIGVVLAGLLFLNRTQELRVLYVFLKDFLWEFGTLSLTGYVITVLWFRFKFVGEVFIKRLLTGMLGTFLAISLYIHFASSIGNSVLSLFLILMIVATWYFELPMNKIERPNNEEMEDILDA